MIRHIIAAIAKRRGIEWRQPDCIHAKRRHMIQPPGDALQIPLARSGRVLKRTGIDLIDRWLFGLIAPLRHAHAPTITPPLGCSVCPV
jgi:hypothetical protein